VFILTDSMEVAAALGLCRAFMVVE
jgi:hypothetical protein